MVVHLDRIIYIFFKLFKRSINKKYFLDYYQSKAFFIHFDIILPNGMFFAECPKNNQNTLKKTNWLLVKLFTLLYARLLMLWISRKQLVVISESSSSLSYDRQRAQQG